MCACNIYIVQHTVGSNWNCFQPIKYDHHQHDNIYYNMEPDYWGGPGPPLLDYSGGGGGGGGGGGAVAPPAPYSTALLEQ